MFTGIDIGGTNTDIAVVDEGISTVKMPNSEGIAAALSRITIRGRLAVSTSQPLNRLVTVPDSEVHTLTIPGPGLVYPGSISGMVNHRGDVLEDISPEEVRERLSNTSSRYLAISGKFSVRNPALEKKVLDLALGFYPADRIAMSYGLGKLGFPARIATTEVNARIMDITSAIAENVRAYSGDYFFFKGDGGLTSPEDVIKNPSVLYHSSPAAVALGASYLSGQKDCLVLDIGGTTTDVVELSDGRPSMVDVRVEGRDTFIRSVKSVSVPLGGDSVIDTDIKPQRRGNALAFGGEVPTLTDALNLTGASIGNPDRSRSLDRVRAETALEHYLDAVTSKILQFQPRVLVCTGFLAPYFIEEISRRTMIPAEVPEHAACANAVGVAVSRVSLSLHVHADSERERIVINSIPQRFRGGWTDEEIQAFAVEEIRKRAVGLGAPEEDVSDIRISYFSAYNVVRSGRRVERIADLEAAIQPGITVEAP